MRTLLVLLALAACAAAPRAPGARREGDACRSHADCAVGLVCEESASACARDECDEDDCDRTRLGEARCDTVGNVTYLNAEAEALTGWTRAEAFARPLGEVFDVTDGLTGQRAQDPSQLAIAHDRKVRLKGNYILVGRDGKETAIEHSAAPIHDRTGKILGAVIVFRDVIVSRERRLQMLHLAEHDALTDLPNRLLLNDRLARAIALARRYGRRLAVLFLDCDRFKHINDTLGHATGDQVLRSVARRLTTCVRESDTVSRHGGDEFLVLLSEVDQPEDAGLIGQRQQDTAEHQRTRISCPGAP